MNLENATLLFSLLDAPIHVFSKSDRGVIGGKIPSPEALVRWVNAATRPEDFYVCLNPSVTNRIKPAIEDITSVKWWMLDFDPLDTATDSALLMKSLDVALAQLFFPRPSYYWINSGRGRQAWFPLDEIKDVELGQRIVKGLTQEVFDIMKALPGAKGWTLDYSCSEVSHLARMFGTTNTKTMREATFWQPYGSRPLSFDEVLAHAIPPAPPPLGPTWQPEWTGSARETAFILSKLSPFNRAFLMSGTSIAIESRHNRLFATAKELHELGVPHDVALFLLTGAADACYPNLNVSDPGYVSRTLRSIYATR